MRESISILLARLIRNCNYCLIFLMAEKEEIGEKREKGEKGEIGDFIFFI
jgi:hypothetical protein